MALGWVACGSVLLLYCVKRRHTCQTLIPHWQIYVQQWICSEWNFNFRYLEICRLHQSPSDCASMKYAKTIAIIHNNVQHCKILVLWYSGVSSTWHKVAVGSNLRCYVHFFYIKHHKNLIKPAMFATIRLVLNYVNLSFHFENKIC